MAKTEKRRKPTRLPAQIERTIDAAEDKKAIDLVVLDLRKAAGFTDFFVIASGAKPQAERPLTLICETCTGRCACWPIFKISSSDSRSCEPSLRMCDA